MKISKSESYLKNQDPKYIDVDHLRNYNHYYFFKHEVKQVLIIVTQ